MRKFIKIFKRIMFVILLFIIVLVTAFYFYTKLPKFGSVPQGDRLAAVEKSPHYKNGKFRNIEEKPHLSKGYSTIGQLFKTLFYDYPHREPLDSLPSIKTDLKHIPKHANVLVWFGHSSFFLQLDSVKILVDPVFSGYASPIPGAVKAYRGSDIYTVEDMPDIDYMLLSHDHYDHLDYKTAKALRLKVRKVICGLGAGAHYERWGYNQLQIIEKDWGDTIQVKPNFMITTESTHHVSGRGFKTEQSQWLSFLIASPELNIYYSGDGGYSNRFSKISEKYPKIDWAIMECGQYDTAWHSVHELPEEVANATDELKAKNMLPIHNSKFTLSKHPWYEPLQKISELSINKSYRLATPMIGEIVRLDDNMQRFTQWWKTVR